mgnify:CR=1 FL=1
MAEEKRDPALETEETAVQPEGASPKKKKEPETLESTLYCWTQALVTAVVSVVLLFTFGFPAGKGPPPCQNGEMHLPKWENAFRKKQKWRAARTARPAKKRPHGSRKLHGAAKGTLYSMLMI